MRVEWSVTLLLLLFMYISYQLNLSSLSTCNKMAHSDELQIPHRIQLSSRVLFDRFVSSHLIAVRHSLSIALQSRIESVNVRGRILNDHYSVVLS